MDSDWNPAPTISSDAPAAFGSDTAEGTTAVSATGGRATVSAAPTPSFAANSYPRRK